MINKLPSKILVIGCGSIGERHIRNLKAFTRSQIFACDRDKKRREHIEDKYEVRVFRDYKEAFNEEMDAVLVCTPTSAHIGPALAAIRQGCHVLIEKPLSHTLRGVDDLIEEAGRKGLVLMVGFNFRFHPALRQIREIIETKQIGKLIAVRAHAGSYFLYRSPYHSWMDYRQDYAAKRVGGGVILDSATHHIDYITSLLGEVREVFCYSGKMSNLGLQGEDIAEILLKFETGAMASLHVNFVQQPYQNKYEIIGEKGTITWDVTENAVKLFSGTDNKWQTFSLEDNFDHNETYVQELTHFLGCIYGGGQPPVDGARGKRILEIALAAKKSAQTGRPITC